ncbi:DUF6252 family protein [Winogradskyella flava]|uniref:Lipocalin-like domain-containing protein n=1 Tax=Winogradskyella flava TaxID=1884876 RepID=A0A842IR08_9FLAO|nr:DUF6252 family protein [Winogradskyella flava]MBC2844164.1 hypothetical protein [Winogradskyella flava]
MKVLTTVLFMSFAILSTSCGNDDGNSNESTNGSFTAKINGTNYDAEFVNGFIVVLGTNISISGSEANGNNVVINFPTDAEAGDTFTVGGLQFIGSYDSNNGDGAVASEGTLTISAHDPEAKTVSGTFNFIAEPLASGGTSYNITEGRFSSSYDEL